MTTAERALSLRSGLRLGAPPRRKALATPAHSRVRPSCGGYDALGPRACPIRPCTPGPTDGGDPLMRHTRGGPSGLSSAGTPAASKQHHPGSTRRPRIVLVVGALLLAGADLGVKAAAVAGLSGGATVDLGLLNLRLHYNPGVAWVPPSRHGSSSPPPGSSSPA